MIKEEAKKGYYYTDLPVPEPVKDEVLIKVGLSAGQMTHPTRPVQPVKFMTRVKILDPTSVEF